MSPRCFMWRGDVMRDLFLEVYRMTSLTWIGLWPEGLRGEQEYRAFCHRQDHWQLMWRGDE